MVADLLPALKGFLEVLGLPLWRLFSPVGIAGIGFRFQEFVLIGWK